MTDQKLPAITFEYIKSHDYKVHSVHGGIGGINNYGDLVLNLFFERSPIPRKATHSLDKDGRLIPEAIKLDTREGIIRDVLFGIALTPQNAKSLAAWLLQHVEEAELQQEELRKHIKKVEGKK